MILTCKFIFLKNKCNFQTKRCYQLEYHIPIFRNLSILTIKERNSKTNQNFEARAQSMLKFHLKLNLEYHHIYYSHKNHLKF